MQMELAWEHSRNHNCHGQWELSQASGKVFCRVDVFKSKRSCRCWASRSNFWWATSRIILWDVWTGCSCLRRGRRDLLKVQRAFCFPSFELTKPRGANIWRWSWEKQSIATAIAEFSAASWNINRSRLGCFTCLLVDDKDLKGSGWLSKTVMIWAKCLGAMYAEHQPEAAKKACGFPRMMSNPFDKIEPLSVSASFAKTSHHRCYIYTRGPYVTVPQATMKKVGRVLVKRIWYVPFVVHGKWQVPGCRCCHAAETKPGIVVPRASSFFWLRPMASCLHFERLPSAALWLRRCHVIAIDSSRASRFCWWLFEARRSNSNFISAIFHLQQV